MQTARRTEAPRAASARRTKTSRVRAAHTAADTPRPARRAAADPPGESLPRPARVMRRAYAAPGYAVRVRGIPQRRRRRRAEESDEPAAGQTRSWLAGGPALS